MNTEDTTAETGGAPRRLWKLSDFTAEGRARGLTLKGHDWVLAPHKKVRAGKGELSKPAQALITDADAVGMTHWGDAGATGYSWGLRGREYHAYWSGTRAGQRQSQHACSRLRQLLAAEIVRLTGRALYWYADVDPESYRGRELARLRLALANPVWQCEQDGPVVEHAPVDPSAVALFAIGAGE